MSSAFNDDWSTTLVWVKSCSDIMRLPLTTSSVGVLCLDDLKAEALSQIASIRSIVHDGSPQLTDAGVLALARLPLLEFLDLEWCSNITDRSIEVLLCVPSLKSVVLDFCAGLSSSAVQRLKLERPALEVSW